MNSDLDARIERLGQLGESLGQDHLAGLAAPGELGGVPALAAAATMGTSTVVGVIPASTIGGRPVAREYRLSMWRRPSASSTMPAIAAW